MEWEIKKEKDRKHHKRLGKTFREPVYKEPEINYQDVEIEFEVFTEISCTSGDSDEDLEKSITISQFHSVELYDEKSSDHFRKVANKRIIKNSIKYNKEFSDLFDKSNPFKNAQDYTAAFKK